MNRVLLVNPWIYDFKAYDFWMKPLGLLYVAAYLRNAGYKIDFIDCLDRYHQLLLKKASKLPVVDQFGRGKFYSQEIEKPEIYQKIPRKYKRYGIPPEIFNEILDNTHKPDWVCVTSIMSYWYPGVFTLIKILKEHFPKTPIILGGIYATLCYNHAKQFSGADYVVNGPAESNLNRIFPELNPCSFQHPPYPAFDLYSRLDYACIITSQGCPFACSYCAVTYLNPDFIYRDTNSVINEILYYQNLEIKNIAFYDDALLANPSFSTILDEIIRRNVKLQFHTPNGLHPRFFTQEIADKMFQAGFKTIYLSLETIDATIHNSKDDKVTIQEFISAIEYLKNSGFLSSQIHAYLMIGLPELTHEQIIKSIDFVSDLGVIPHLAEFSPIPKTVDFRRLGFDENTDPCLHNNAIFPALNPDMREQMAELKAYLSKLRHKQYKI